MNKYTEENPGAGVSVDQLQSYQTGLVTQFSGKITSACIWDAQVIVDHSIGLTYLHLMLSKI